MEPRHAGRSVLLVQWSAMQKHGLFGHSFPLGSFVVFVTSPRLVTSFRYSTTRAQPDARDARAAAAVHNPRRAPHKTPNHRTLRFAPPRSFFTLFFFSLICLRDFVTLAISSCRRTRCLGSNFFMASTVS